MRTSKRNLHNLWYVVTAIVIIVGCAAWLHDLNSDPPMYFSGMGQSLSTDPAMYTHHARNKILFGSFEPFADYRWIAFKFSVVSVLSYLGMSVAGVSLTTANIVAVTLSIGGLLILLASLAPFHRLWVGAAVSTAYLVNVVLYTYGRLTYLENGLILLASLVFFAFSRWGKQIRGQFFCGVLIGLATAIGKLFGALLLPALTASAMIQNPERRWRSALVIGAGFTVSFVSLAMLLYGQHVFEAFGFYGEQSMGLHGFPEGLTSPWGFLEHLVSFGFKNHLFYQSPDTLLMLIVAVLMLVILLSNREVTISRLSPPATLAFFWAIFMFLGLMPLNYSPLRYSLPMLPAIVVACFAILDSAMSEATPPKITKSRWLPIVAGLCVWMTTVQFVLNYLYFGAASPDTRTVVWASLPAGLVVGVVLWWLLNRREFSLSYARLSTIALVLVALSLVLNGSRIRRSHVEECNFNISEANRDLALILGREATLSGPYASALTQENRLASVIHFFGAAEFKPDFFREFPVTHIACDASNWQNAIEMYPELRDQKPLATYWIRDHAVGIYNVSQMFGNPVAQAYQLTPYEAAYQFAARGQIDSAVEILRDSDIVPKESKSYGLLYADLLIKRQKYNAAKQLLEQMADRFRTDFSIQLACGQFLQQLAVGTSDRYLLSQAEQYFARAVEVNRYKAQFAAQLWQHNLSQGSPELSAYFSPDLPPSGTIAVAGVAPLTATSR